MDTRTTVLLGAGASADAGLPLTFQLAEMVVSRANNPKNLRYDASGSIRALNFVYGAMVGYQAEDGSNPLASVNIERLISAVRLLREAKTHEVAPFVASWRSGALGVGTPPPDPTLSRRVFNAIDDHLTKRRASFADRDMVAGIADIALAAVGSGNPRAFEVAENNLLEDLSEILGSPKRVDYLAPIADIARSQPGGVDVLTLNYDLTVEAMALANGVPIERGINRWVPGEPLLFQPTDGQINLIKIHGSLDWLQVDAGTPLTPPRISLASEEGDAEEQGWRRARRPWIVVGEREKLATDGPTLDLLRAAEDALRRTQHLVVVGYSFGDAHINGLIRNWLLGNADRTIGIVDTNWNRGALGTFREALIREYGSSQSPARKSRVIPIVGTAGERLGEALHARPAEVPEIYGKGSIEPIGERARIRARLLGPDLFRVSVNVRELDEQALARRPMGLDTFLDADAVNTDIAQTSYRLQTAPLDQWRNGEELTLFSRLPAPGGAVLEVRGARLDSAYSETLSFPLQVSDYI